MSNEQTDYTYQSSQPDEINIDPTGTVKFISKPSGTVTITATPKAQGFPAVTYQFNPTSTWAIPQSGNGSWAISQSKCGVGNVLNRKELTNSPRNTAPMGWSYVANYYTRAIGGGIFGEWGTADKISYPNSQWNGILFWVDEVHTTNSRQYLVNHSNGLVTWAGLAYAGYVACRG